MWQILRDLDSMIKEEPSKDVVNVESVKRAREKRIKKEAYRQVIYNYLRKYNKGMGMLTKDDIGIMTEGLNSMDTSMFMDEVKYCLETNYGKPISWIVKNRKCLLFDKK